MSEATINTSRFSSIFFFGRGVEEGWGVKTEIGRKTPMGNRLNKPYMEVEGNQTTGKTSIAGWNTGGTDMGRTHRQARVRTAPVPEEHFMFLKTNFRFLSSYAMFILRPVPATF